MSNQIRPLLGPDNQLVLEIAVESAVQRFTWVIFDEEGRVLAGDEVDRQATPSGIPLGQEFSIPVTERHIAYPSEKLHLKHDEIHDDGGDPDGGFQVRLYDGHPQRRGSAQTRFGKL